MKNPPIKKSQLKELEELQKWFGEAISKPLPQEYEVNPLKKSKPSLEAEANGILNSKGGFSGFDRLGIYNQQYWFRLITIMQGEYSCLVHIMGLKNFNQLVIQFLGSNPPASPYLAELDLGFAQFVTEYFGAPELVGQSKLEENTRTKYLQALGFDRAFSKAIDAQAGKSVFNFSKVNGVPAVEIALSQKIVLSPHVSVLHLDYDFATYRLLCSQDESLTAEFDLIPNSSNVIIYRDRDLKLKMQLISNAARLVLQELQVPTRVVDVFERLEGRFSKHEHHDLETNLTGWFKYWIEENWLCVE